jgi:peptidoglycan/xylan/chitin deacetylase (PgdA/CDA1 family)
MILMYHKVDVVAPTQWWVRKERFAQQLAELSGFEFVFLDRYDSSNPRHCVITFDDAYENVYRHAFPLLAELKLPFEVFINSGYLGGWNHFDASEPMTRFCSIDQLEVMASNCGRVQWHTNLHQDLTSISGVDLENELIIPDYISNRFSPPNLRWLAYPYGSHNEAVVQSARKLFDGALSVGDGNMHDMHQLNRVTVTEETSFRHLML